MESVASPHWSETVSCATLSARHLDAAPWVLELVGETDVATVAFLRRELTQLVRSQCEHAVLDLTRLTFCDVASAHLILTAGRLMPVTVTGATRSVKRVFDLMESLEAQRLPHYLAPNPLTRQPVVRSRLSA
jgi:anti-anti-sigma regulatory factor